MNVVYPIDRIKNNLIIYFYKYIKINCRTVLHSLYYNDCKKMKLYYISINDIPYKDIPMDHTLYTHHREKYMDHESD